jgi:hypothetical protein
VTDSYFPVIPGAADPKAYVNPGTIGAATWGRASLAPTNNLYSLPAALWWTPPPEYAGVAAGGYCRAFGKRLVCGPQFDRISLAESTADTGGTAKPVPQSVTVTGHKWASGSWTAAAHDKTLQWNRPIDIRGSGGASLIDGHPLGNPNDWYEHCPLMPLSFSLPGGYLEYQKLSAFPETAPFEPGTEDVVITNPLDLWQPNALLTAPTLIAARAYGTAGYRMTGVDPYTVALGYKTLEYDLWLWFDQPVQVNPSWQKRTGGVLNQVYSRDPVSGNDAFIADDWTVDVRFNVVRITLKKMAVSPYAYYWYQTVPSVNQLACTVVVDPTWLVGLNGLGATGSQPIEWAESPVRFCPAPCPTADESERGLPGRTGALEWLSPAGVDLTHAGYPTAKTPIPTADYPEACLQTPPFPDPVPYGTSAIPRHWPLLCNLGTQCPISTTTPRIFACEITEVDQYTVYKIVYDDGSDPFEIKTYGALVAIPGLADSYFVDQPSIRQLGDLSRKAYIPRTRQWLDITPSAGITASGSWGYGIWSDTASMDRTVEAEFFDYTVESWGPYCILGMPFNESLSSLDVQPGDVILIYSSVKGVRTRTGDFPLVNHRRWPFTKYHQDDSTQVYSEAGGTWFYSTSWNGAAPDPAATLTVSISYKAYSGPFNLGTVLYSDTQTFIVSPVIVPRNYMGGSLAIWVPGFSYSAGEQVWDGTDFLTVYSSVGNGNTAPLTDPAWWTTSAASTWLIRYSGAVTFTGLPSRPCFYSESMTAAPNAYIPDDTYGVLSCVPTVLYPTQLHATLTGQGDQHWPGQLPPDNAHVTGL